MKILSCMTILLLSLGIADAAPVPVGKSDVPDPNGMAVLGVNTRTTKVVAFYPVSPFQKAGGKFSDSIIQIGDNKVTDLKSLNQALAQYRPGATINVKVKRDMGRYSQEHVLTITLGAESLENMVKNKNPRLTNVDLPPPGPIIILPRNKQN